jgi:hypothetical protein
MSKFMEAMTRFLENDSHWEKLEGTKATITYEDSTVRKDAEYINNYNIFVKEYNNYLKRRDGIEFEAIDAFPLSPQLIRLYVVFLTTEARYFTSSIETLHLNALKRHCKQNSIPMGSDVSHMMTNMVGVMNHMNYDSEKAVDIRHPIMETDFLKIVQAVPVHRHDRLESLALFSLAGDSGLRSISLRHIVLADFKALTILNDGKFCLTPCLTIFLSHSLSISLSLYLFFSLYVFLFLLLPIPLFWCFSHSLIVCTYSYYIILFIHFFLGTQVLLLRITRSKAKKNLVNKFITVGGNFKIYGPMNTLWYLDEYLNDSFGLNLSDCATWSLDLTLNNKPLFPLSSDQMVKRIQLYAYNAGYPEFLFDFHSFRSGIICNAIANCIKENRRSIQEICDLVRLVVDWASERVMKRYIRDVFTMHYVVNSLSNSTVKTKLIPLEVLNNPAKMHKCNIASARWPVDTSYKQFACEWKVMFTFCLHPSLSSDEKDSLTQTAFNKAIVLFAKSNTLCKDGNFSAHMKIGREFILNHVNSYPASFESIKAELNDLVEEEFSRITKDDFLSRFKSPLPKIPQNLEKKRRNNWSAKESSDFQHFFAMNKKKDGTYDYKKIIDEFLPFCNRTIEQIRWRITWSARKEKKLEGNLSESSGLLSKRKL